MPGPEQKPRRDRDASEGTPNTEGPLGDASSIEDNQDSAHEQTDTQQSDADGQSGKETEYENAQGNEDDPDEVTSTQASAKHVYLDEKSAKADAKSQEMYFSLANMIKIMEIATKLTTNNYRAWIINMTETQRPLGTPAQMLQVPSSHTPPGGSRFSLEPLGRPSLVPSRRLTNSAAHLRLQYSSMHLTTHGLSTALKENLYIDTEAHRARMGRGSGERSKEPLGLLHIDLIIDSSESSHTEYTCTLVAVDEHGKHVDAVQLEKKSDASCQVARYDSLSRASEWQGG